MLRQALPIIGYPQLWIIELKSGPLSLGIERNASALQFYLGLRMRDRRNASSRTSWLMIRAKLILSLGLHWDRLPRAFPYHGFTVQQHAR